MVRTLLSPGARMLSCAAALSMFGCAEATQDAPEPPNAKPDLHDARFAVMTEVAGKSGTQSYLSLTSSLSAREPVSLKHAMPVAGRGLVLSRPGSPEIYVTGDSPAITRYRLAVDGKLVPSGQVDFKFVPFPEPIVIGEYASQLPIVSDTKAYFFERRLGELRIWNPTTMKDEDQVNLNAFMPNSVLTFSSAGVVRRPGQIALGIGYRAPQGERVIPTAALVVVDTATNKPTILRDDRCGFVRDAVEGADGRVYLATEAWGSVVHRVHPDLAPAPCLLRTDAALTQIDPTFHRDLNALAGGVAGSLVKSLDGKVFTKVLDEKAAKITKNTLADDVVKAPVWRWAEVKLGDAPTITKLADSRLGTGRLVVIDTADKRFVAEVEPTRTSLVDLTTGVGPVTISTPGGTYAVAQFR